MSIVAPILPGSANASTGWLFFPDRSRYSPRGRRCRSRGVDPEKQAIESASRLRLQGSSVTPIQWSA